MHASVSPALYWDKRQFLLFQSDDWTMSRGSVAVLLLLLCPFRGLLFPFLLVLVLYAESLHLLAEHLYLQLLVLVVLYHLLPHPSWAFCEQLDLIVCQDIIVCECLIQVDSPTFALGV